MLRLIQWGFGHARWSWSSRRYFRSLAGARARIHSLWAHSSFLRRARAGAGAGIYINRDDLSFLDALCSRLQDRWVLLEDPGFVTIIWNAALCTVLSGKTRVNEPVSPGSMYERVLAKPRILEWPCYVWSLCLAVTLGSWSVKHK